MNPPANWYPDPTGRHGQRYWDGSQWTEHVFTDGHQSVDPLESADDDTATDETAADQVHDVEDEDEASGDEAADVGATSDARDEGQPAPVGSTTAPVSETAADAETDVWRPAEEQDAQHAEATTDDAGADDPGDRDEEEEVAPELDAEDVVATLDEVENGDAPEPDFSDAFVLAPETASRLVGGGGGVPDAADAPEPDHAPVTQLDAETVAPAGAIDAPPPAMPNGAPATPDTAVPAATGITGSLLSGAFAEDEDAGPVALQNARLLRCSLAANQTVVARQGTMVAYQGDVSFERQGAGGLGKALKRAATGEGLSMMRVEGTGDVFFADAAQHVFLLELGGGPGLSVNGRNVLAFDAGLDWDIERVKGANLLAGGLFNTTLEGTGWVALVSDGEPVVLRTEGAPTYVDVNALVAWTGGLQTRIVNTVSAKSLVGLGSGEAFQMAFEGDGVVIVQPSEGAAGGATASG